MMLIFSTTSGPFLRPTQPPMQAGPKVKRPAPWGRQLISI